MLDAGLPLENLVVYAKNPELLRHMPKRICCSEMVKSKAAPAFSWHSKRMGKLGYRAPADHIIHLHQRVRELVKLVLHETTKFLAFRYRRHKVGCISMLSLHRIFTRTSAFGFFCRSSTKELNEIWVTGTNRGRMCSWACCSCPRFLLSLVEAQGQAAQ